MHSRLLTALLLLLTACPEPPTRSEGSDDLSGGGCELASSTALAPDEQTNLQTTVGELSAWLSGDHVATLTWADTGDDALTLGLVPEIDGAVWESWREAPGDDGIDIAYQCYDRLAIPATLTLDSGDGRLAESWSVTVAFEESDDGPGPGDEDYTPVAQIQHAPDTFSGTLDVEDFITETPYDAMSTTLQVELWENGSVSGSLSVEYEGSDEETAWAASENIADFRAGPNAE